MYKHIYKKIKNNLHKEENFVTNLWKNSDKKHAIHDKQPHFIFSAENPMHPAKSSMSHSETLNLLHKKGYNAESIDGKYGNNEKSILVHNPPKHTFKHLNNFASSLGQDSTLISDGQNHELHYVNGPNSGRHHKGSGTVFHKEEPSDFYSTLSDGSHFTHGLDFDKTHKDSQFIKPKDEKMQKSEKFIVNGSFKLYKAESKRHKFETAGSDTKLIHYSPQKNLQEINPDHHGVRKVGSEAKQGAPDHKMSFYYAEGVNPEAKVTSGTKSKYVVSLGNKKLYDIHKDNDGLFQQAMSGIENSPNYRGQIMPYEKRPAYHQAIKDAGYHGIYNSGLEDTMSHAVGMFDTMKPDSEHKMHPNDFKETSSIDHHKADESINSAKEYHHDGDFLHNLKTKLVE